MVGGDELTAWVGGELCLLGDDDLARGKSGDGRARSRSRTATHGEGGSGAGTKSGSLAAQGAASSGARRRSVDLLDLGKFSARSTQISAKKASSTGPCYHPVLEVPQGRENLRAKPSGPVVPGGRTARY